MISISAHLVARQTFNDIAIAIAECYSTCVRYLLVTPETDDVDYDDDEGMEQLGCQRKAVRFRTRSWWISMAERLIGDVQQSVSAPHGRCISGIECFVRSPVS